MRGLVDTSIWALALRRSVEARNPETTELRRLIAAQVVEIIGPIPSYVIRTYSGVGKVTLKGAPIPIVRREKKNLAYGLLNLVPLSKQLGEEHEYSKSTDSGFFARRRS